MDQIRGVLRKDLEALKAVLDSIDLFPAEMLEELIADYLDNPESTDLWFTKTEGDTPISIGFCAPEKLTEGTFNLYAIGVRKDCQGRGVGRQMMAFIETQLKEAGHRVLIVETSGTEAFELTRAFYKQLHYSEEAVIRDFWKEGDDKVIFWKKLT